ncbi:MAG: dicarboxylate/amino acid:cation symporter [Bifidobacteriaceae bacterium]|jgi:Na+/H+-dicarboxylate symporter|nr:dicarboxylate/amino acid:cation symporter [Bifidobacteriaceae bacterium]
MSAQLSAAGVLALVAALSAALFWARRKGLGFTSVTLAALALGAGVGLAFPHHADWLEPIGKIYVGLLGALVGPLIVVSLLASVTSLGSAAKLRGIGLRSVGWLTLTTLIAGLLALGLGLAFGVGRGARLTTQGLDPAEVEGRLTPVGDVIAGFFPTNLVADFGQNKVVPIIVATSAVAVAYVLVAARRPDAVRPFKDLVGALREIVYKVVKFVIALTPYAVLALVASATAGGIGRGAIAWSLVVLLAVSVLALAIDTWVVNGVLLRAFAKVRVGAFFRRIAPAQLVGFTTQSSVGTLPATTEALTARIGVSQEVAGFTAPLGATIGMPGCSGIWPVIVAVYGANGLGLSYGPGDWALLVAVGLLVSLGTAGVPGTATITSASTLAAVGLPLEIVLLVVPISAIVDTARTATNVTAAAVASTIVARQTGALDGRISLRRDAFLADAAPSAPAPISGSAPTRQHDAAPVTS